MIRDEGLLRGLSYCLVGAYTAAHSTGLDLWGEEGNDTGFLLFSFRLLAKVRPKGVNHAAFQHSSSSLEAACTMRGDNLLV